MSVRISCNNKQILHVKNAILRSLYFNMLKNIEESQTIFSDNLLKFINEDFYQATEGLNTNITDFLKTKDELLVFADLIKKAIESEQKSNNPFISSIEELLSNFYQEIIKCANNL